MIQTIQNFNLLPQDIQSNRGLTNVFSGTTANAAQTHDLLNFRKIGQNISMQYVKYRLLKVPSTSAPIRTQQLLTFAIKKNKNDTQREGE